jgi:hypothetical protein
MTREITRISDIRNFVREHLEKINRKYNPEKQVAIEEVDQYISDNPYFNSEQVEELNNPSLYDKVLDEKYEGYIDELYQNILVWIS